MSRIASRSAAVALSSAALIGLSALAIPGAAAADVDCDPADVTYSVTGGSIKWGFKQSFRSYFYGLAHGTDTLTGATFEGTKTDAAGAYVWPVTAGTINGAGSATASGEGSVNFAAHGGVLDTTISNPTVEITGTSGVLKLDWVGNEFTTNENSEPVPLGGDQVVAATFTLPTAADFHRSGQVTVTSPASAIGDDFVSAFNNYPSGSALDAVTLVLDITSPCGETGDDSNDDGGIFGSLGRLFDVGS